MAVVASFERAWAKAWGKRPAAPPVQRVQRWLESGNGNNESIWLLGHVGRRSNTLASQRAGSRPLSLAVANRLWMAAARRPARSEPVNSQFVLPMAIGRMAFSTGLLSIGSVPCNSLNLHHIPTCRIRQAKERLGRKSGIIFPKIFPKLIVVVIQLHTYADERWPKT